MRREGKKALIKILNRITLATLPKEGYETAWFNITFDRPSDFQTFFLESKLNFSGKPIISPENCDGIELLNNTLIPFIQNRPRRGPCYHFPLELQDKPEYMYFCHYNDNEDKLETFLSKYYNWIDFSQINYFYNWFNLSSGSLFKKEYFGILIFLIIAILLSLVIITLSYLFSAHNPETEKLSTYECGFEPYEDSRHTVSIKFCIIAVLFIIFDIEIIYLIPWSVSLAKLPTLGFWAMLEFILELGIGIFYVWIVKSIEWD